MMAEIADDVFYEDLVSTRESLPYPLLHPFLCSSVCPMLRLREYIRCQVYDDPFVGSKVLREYLAKVHINAACDFSLCCS